MCQISKHTSDLNKNQVLRQLWAFFQVRLRCVFRGEVVKKLLCVISAPVTLETHQWINPLCSWASSHWRIPKFVVGFFVMILFCGLTHAQNNEFATDADSILEQLRDSHSENTVTSKEGVFSKGGIYTSPLESAVDDSSLRVTVLQEVEGKSGARSFAVVQRQSIAQRVNLRILFDVDSAAIRPESYPLLGSLADALSSPELAGQVMAVNGHTDSTGSDEHNLQLSFNRARSVRDYLVNREGINQSMLKVFGFGEVVPLVANSSAVNRQKNRRVEIERFK